MDKLKQKHKYLVHYIHTGYEDFDGLQMIFIQKITNKAIKIWFEELEESRWFEKEDPDFKIEIFEDITHF